MPRSSATARATDSASPVIITTSMPSRCSASTAWRDSGRTSSASFSAPTTTPSTSTCSTIAPSSRHASHIGQLILARLVEQSRTADPDPVPVDRRLDPTAGDELNPTTRGTTSPRRRGASTIALASGCSLSASAAAASASTWSSESAVTAVVDDRGDGRLALGQRAGLVEQHGVDGAHALQREPVLDQHAAAGGAFGRDRHHQRDRQAQRVRAGDDQHRDGAHHRLVGLPEAAPHDGGDDRGAQCEPEQPARRPVGQPLCPRRGVLRLGDQALDAGQRGVVADGGDRDAKPGVGGDGARDDVVARRPGAPARDSPVTIDSSTSADPSTISPSAGTLPPGRTTTTSPTRSSDGATVSRSCRRRRRRSASSGSRAASESSAEVVCASDRISIQWPSSMITISSASSHQKSSWWCSRPRLAPHDDTNATVMASPISSIIPGARERISLTAPVRNGRPPQTYITVPSTGETHCAPGKSGQRVAEDHREHRRERHRRNGEHEHHPEQAPERRDVVTVVTVSVCPP